MRFIRSFGFGLAVLLAAVPAVSWAQGSKKGWVGVVITTGIGSMNESGAMVFNDYPTVESIDPGSPAQRAGLQAGDILISINSQDFRKNPIPMARFLLPGQKIVFRYKRNDRARIARLTVTERPAEAKSYVQFQLISPIPTMAVGGGRELDKALLNRNVAVDARRREPLFSIAPLVMPSGSPTLRLVGAELTQLNEGLREALNVKGEGIFVISVAMGTPAGAAGLKGGDVIIEAANEALQNPGELIRLMKAATDNSLLLRVLRQQKPQNLTLRW